MRAALVFMLLLAAGSVDAAERTWTIARDVYHADGELVAVRGGLAYLKINGKVEEVPVERLSATDQDFIASLSLAPILPGPAETDESSVLVSPAVAEEEIPLPGAAPAPGELELNAPDLAPAYGGAPIRAPGAQQPRTRFDRYGRTIPPQPGTAANYVAPWGDPRLQGNPNAPRGQRGSQQGNDNPNARGERDDDDDDRPGVFGFRARRLERERAAANRSR